MYGDFAALTDAFTALPVLSRPHHGKHGIVALHTRNDPMLEVKAVLRHQGQVELARLDLRFARTLAHPEHVNVRGANLMSKAPAPQRVLASRPLQVGLEAYAC